MSEALENYERIAIPPEEGAHGIDSNPNSAKPKGVGVSLETNLEFKSACGRVAREFHLAVSKEEFANAMSCCIPKWLSLIGKQFDDSENP